MTEKLFIKLALILPNIPDERDSCVIRLCEKLQIPGLEKVHVTPHDEEPYLCVHYDPTLIGLAQLKSIVKQAGAELDERYQHEVMRIDGMDCTTCATVIEHSLSRLDGVMDVSVSYVAERMRIEFDHHKVSRHTIIARLKALGYSVVELHSEISWRQQYRELIVSVIAAAFLLVGWLLTFAADNTTNKLVSAVLMACSIATGGYYAMRDAWQSIRERELDIDVLMIFAAVGAVALGQWGEGALLLVLFSLGHALEHLAMDRARYAIESLADLAPKTALVVRDDKKFEIKVEELLRGDHVMVKPGQRIPADGKVIAGSSAVNQAAITGESMPVEKAIGALVYSGSINGEGTLTLEVTKLAKESALALMVQLVTEAQTEKSATQNLVTRFEKFFVPTVLIFVAGLIVIPPLLGVPFAESFYRAMAVLVAASPCALAIATPSAVLAGVARAARGGVLIKGGIHLENLRSLTAIAFDKTGTITTGKPSVTDVELLAGDEATLLATAASVEVLSGHPLAQAVVEAARSRGIVWENASEIRSVTGRGMHAMLTGKQISIGNLRLFDQDVPETVLRIVNRLEGAGKTTILVKVNHEFIGVLGLADTARPGIAITLQKLMTLGVNKFAMLTGDNQQVANSIASVVGIHDVRAGLLPEDKLLAIDQLMQEYGHVAMIGDGVNDAPAMSRATLGIAMGGAGTDVALESADVALMGDDIGRLPFAISLSHASHRIIQQNLWAAFGVVAILIPATLFGWANMGFAVVIHEGTTVLVVLNALRLLNFYDSYQTKQTE